MDELSLAQPVTQASDGSPEVSRHPRAVPRLSFSNVSPASIAPDEESRAKTDEVDYDALLAEIEESQQTASGMVCVASKRARIFRRKDRKPSRRSHRAEAT